MRMIHLSDPHIGMAQNHVAAGQIVHHIIDHFDAHETLIALTGDTVDSPNKAQIELAIKTLKPLQEHGFDLAIVPGNHDLFARGLDLGALSKVQAQGYQRMCVELGALGRHVGPWSWWWEGYKIIGLNSMAGTAEDWEVDLAQGAIGERQLLWLTQEIQDTPSIVLTHHHPLWHDQAHLLEDHEQLRSILEPRAHMVLFGHRHQEGLWERQGVLYIASGRSTQKTRNKLTYRVIDLATREVAMMAA